MRVYAVRNVDGQLGIVAARNRLDAVERLDEFANFEGCPILELQDVMFLVDINDEGALTLEQLGEEMEGELRTFAYPLVEEVRNCDEAGEDATLIRKAVEAERERIRRRRTAQPLTERGREVTHQLDLPASLVRKHERQVARTIVERTKVPSDPRKRH